MPLFNVIFLSMLIFLLHFLEIEWEIDLTQENKKARNRLISDLLKMSLK